MDKQNLENILHYLIKQGLETIKANTEEVESTIDYVAIFAKNKDEFDALDAEARSMGTEVDTETVVTGHTYLLSTPVKTSVGLLKFIKIRFPDPTRPQRGAPDFKVQNYQEFKNKYIRKSGNFTLMLKEKYEMIEIKGIDVLVYIPDNTLSERLETK
jgi:hypothetical protein